jgi:hypothetical protein
VGWGASDDRGLRDSLRQIGVAYEEQVRHFDKWLLPPLSDRVPQAFWASVDDTLDAILQLVFRLQSDL